MKRTSLASLRDEMRAVARGACAPPPRPAAQLLATLSPEALELLGIVLRERPATIADVVRLTGRSQPNVSRSLQQLAGHGLVRLVRTGREVRPEPLVRTLRVDLSEGTYETEPAAAPA
ncbi:MULTISPECIES: MarR family transcriptional regulator [Methylobacterium]|uniref:HVO_A0114 family putative DNA-binding protein n=1 Tax=Methylobacterium TaxID=407 RepID=UPI0010491D9F|nr:MULTISPECIES: MarR family transcriptional regulator [Methylobacterium]MDR7035349.1 putative transcriptional regulator [Methylobacterium sp. BE186]